MSIQSEVAKLRDLISTSVLINGDGERREMLAALTALETAHEKAVVEALQAERARVAHDPSVSRAVEMMFREVDGRRIIERAYRADPQRTTIELNYLGGHSIAGELRVDRGLRLRQRELNFGAGT